MFWLVRQLHNVSLLTERGLIRAAGAINISLRWSEATFSKLHFKLESTNEK
jgi:hypothetical protein